jgi:23S rRNA (adenine2030-N6)-methyltransferase
MRKLNFQPPIRGPRAALAAGSGMGAGGVKRGHSGHFLGVNYHRILAKIGKKVKFFRASYGFCSYTRAMLSYQHAYHAGNAADVLKHSVWAAVLQTLLNKDKPLQILETHAGRGVYPVTVAETARGAEYKTGLASLNWHTSTGNPYSNTVKKLNQDGVLQVIPGSPAVAQNLLRESPDWVDHLHLCEAHPTEANYLEAWRRSLTTHWQHVHIHQADGHQHVPALVKAGLRTAVLIDPSYEVKTEYEQTVATVSTLLQRNPHAVVVVWYPLLSGGGGKGLHQKLIDGLKALNIQATHLSQWQWAKREQSGMYGSGQVVLNLPFGLEKSLPTTVQELAKQLKISARSTTLTWLVPRR